MADGTGDIVNTLRFRGAGTTPFHPQHAVDEIRAAQERALAGHGALIEDEAIAVQAVLSQLTGFGGLQPLIDDPTIEEIWLNGARDVFIARNGVSERVPLHLADDEVRNIVERMLSGTGRRIDLSQPFVDASLPDGSRLHVVIPDVTRAHWAVNIRKFMPALRTMDTLVAHGMLSQTCARFLSQSMKCGANIVVAGPTHAGKTTLLNSLLAACAPNTRVITVEETFEIACPLEDVVAMQCRPANLEGSGEITLRRLVKEALRMRPDRIVVGEVREAECLDLLIALNAGIPGLATIHANSAREALVKLCTLPLLAGRNIDSTFVVPTVAASVDLVVHCRMTPSGHRYVSEIIAPTGSSTGGVIEHSVLFRSAQGGGLVATGALPQRCEKYVAAGVDLSRILAAA